MEEDGKVDFPIDETKTASAGINESGETDGEEKPPAKTKKKKAE